MKINLSLKICFSITPVLKRDKMLQNWRGCLQPSINSKITGFLLVIVIYSAYSKYKESSYIIFTNKYRKKKMFHTHFFSILGNFRRILYQIWSNFKELREIWKKNPKIYCPNINLYKMLFVFKPPWMNIPPWW